MEYNSICSSTMSTIANNCQQLPTIANNVNNANVNVNVVCIPQKGGVRDGPQAVSAHPGLCQQGRVSLRCGVQARERQVHL
jgi:hypothetical protein